MTAFTDTSIEFGVPISVHDEMCALMERRFGEGQQPFNKTMALEQVPDPAGLSVRYRASQHIVDLFRRPKNIPEEAGPSSSAALLKAEIAQPLPVSDEWPNVYLTETFTAGVLSPRFQHFTNTLWRRDVTVEYYTPDEGIVTPSPYLLAVIQEIEVGTLSNAIKRLMVADLNRAQELYPDLTEEYMCMSPFERITSLQKSLNTDDLVEIGCEPNPFVRANE